MKMMVIDESNFDWNQMIDKTKEESGELVEAIGEKNKAHIAEEALDIIQVGIGVMDKLQNEGISINFSLMQHEKKLINRGWEPKTIIDIKTL